MDKISENAKNLALDFGEELSPAEEQFLLSLEQQSISLTPENIEPAAGENPQEVEPEQANFLENLNNESAETDVPVSDFIADKASSLSTEAKVSDTGPKTDIVIEQKDISLSEKIFLNETGSAFIQDINLGNSISQTDSNFFLSYQTRLNGSENEAIGRSVTLRAEQNTELLAFAPKAEIKVAVNKPIIGQIGNDELTGTNANNIIYGSPQGTANPISKITLNNPAADLSDAFSFNITISNGIVLAGSVNDDFGATDSGAAYLFNASDGTLLHTIYNPAPSNGDSFGWNTAIDGNRALISAINDDTGSSNTGSAYLYDVTSGALLHTFNNPTPGNNAHFGSSVALSNDVAIIGAEYGTTGGSRPGIAYLYDINTGSLLHTLTNPAPNHMDGFGYTVDISTNYAMVGAISDDTVGSGTGSAYIFDVVTGSLLHILNNPDPSTGYAFGNNVSISDSYALIGATGYNSGVGSAYLYDVVTGGLLHTFSNPTPVTNDRFGWSVSLEGNYAAVSAAFDDTNGVDSGAVYIYGAEDGNLLYTLTNPSGNGAEYFGYSIDVNGNNLAVGTRADKAYIYTIDFTDTDVLYGGAGDDTLYGLFGDDILVGQAGKDKLFGGEGADRFVFEGATVFNGVDRIEDFSLGEGDIIDISDVLTGFTSGVSDINDFVQFVADGADAVMQIDADGAANGANFEAAALIVGGAGFDPAALEALGQLDAVV